ncbi:hypothetical protein EYF80_049404 [Liparis tanakae]|uniref:Uncharacterized protein n=1 Tax=Liparis tanakae TaxID=230148 RepID=A0A4Z2FGS1_9TELE|nr:hypothetical protein EYF80_049404 [Liparis tanakae]
MRRSSARQEAPPPGRRLLRLAAAGRSLTRPAGHERGYSLWAKRGGLSLTSVSLTVTVVVPESPPRWPPMSLA